ncbi:GntR family transcriptional regulator [Georgenia halophila]|uniref:GntR family transcriptional regulator n=1 Tax=Georgenia halophila TaxID=620889 RepID=A0ABP8LEU5_9MICO
MVREAGTRRRTSEEVYRRIRALIVENRIAPGQRINIDALARQLGVSQTPVREAVRQLEGDKLIVKVAGTGYCTTSLLDLDGLRDLFEFRLLVDVWAARSIAVNRLTNPAPAMKKEIARFESLVDGTSDIRRELVMHDTRFHGLVLGALGNDVVREAYEQTHSHLHTIRLYAADTDGTVTLREHRRIWEAVDACDPERAAAVMREHLTAAYARFARAFEEPLAELREPDPYRMF